MRLKKYASSKVVAIILTAMVTLGGLFFQNSQIQNLKKQLSDSQVKIEQMYDTSQTQIDPATIQAELNKQCEFKILDGTVNIKHTYNYEREGFMGIDHTRVLTGTADFYYQITTDLRNAKVIDANDETIVVSINTAEVSKKACHRVMDSFIRMDEECTQSLMSNKKDAEETTRLWEDTFDKKGYEYVKEYYGFADVRSNLNALTEEQIKLLFAKLGYKQDIVVTITEGSSTTIESINNEGEDANMKMVILDSGHNEYVSGKEAPDKSMREWEFNNDMQHRISKLLAEYPEFYVYLTNPEPAKKDEIGLTKRASLANSEWRSKGKPDAMFISLHANAYGVWTNANGCETFHAANASAKSKTFAKILNDEVHITLKELNPKSVNRGVKQANHVVTKNAAMPAVLVEYAFYTNKTDLNILKNNRQELAEATVKAICKYFKIEYKKPVEVNNMNNFLIKVIYEGSDGLNIRQEPTTKSKINGQIFKDQVFTIVEEKNGWGKLKSGAGWISLNSKYVKRL